MVVALMLRASSDILSKAQDELTLRGYTPLQLASELSLAVQLVENFLNGEIVDRNTYDLVCEKLNISINSVQDLSIENQDDSHISNSSTNVSTNSNLVDNAISVTNSNNNISVDKISQNTGDSSSLLAEAGVDKSFQSIRKNISSALIRQCDRFRIIDINTPICLHNLYTEINVFTTLPSSQQLDLNEAFANVSPEQYDRFYLNKLCPPTIPSNQALEESKLILLVGGLGSGKTTLLKYWAMACITGNVLPRYVPLFLPLRSLVSLQDLGDPLLWLKQQLINYGLSDEFLDHQVLDRLVNQGRFLLLCDELDDLPETHRAEIARKILRFSDRYPKNRLVVATRNPIYSHILESFSTVGIAPFEESQITTFASKWFQTTCSDKPKKNEKFQQLLSTNQPLAEIASNPLLLTHLCSVFSNYEYLKPNFYQETLNLLLTKWEQTKCLTSYPNQVLSTSQKLDLLSYVAIVSLDRHGYVWQNNQLEEDFQDCIAASHNLSKLAINYDQVFQLFKWQHSIFVECAKGIYSLAHTTLHDYLAAYRIANSTPSDAQKYLLERIYLKRWHGVIVMTVSISQQADRMLKMMKRKIDDLVSQDPQLQSFLTWVNQQSIQIQTPYKAVTIRALYLDIDLENTRSLDRARALDIAHSRSLERARSKALGNDNTMETEVDIDYTINLALNLDLALYFANHPVLELACILEPDLQRGLQFLRQKFPDPSKNREAFAKWWQSKGLDWSKKLRNLIVQHRKSSQEWQFSDNQLKVLRTYHDANKLLIECLNNAEYVSPLVKSQIESTLLLPQGEYSILQY
ncbi:NACHT domain-containing protein [Pseudanabaena galeata UHCC 0370]|uniref:NACHT domain-containing protein n=1 Tax=Pseudanabaena galeata UHCC 0370 TaxID=3110310 RepID=A0ABU5TPU6_9CYAN|nr:NACHT domain-containing protein [Pseudanabaena galeata]MEA5480199.1 NACHT domain-containing protein [Pseudanabaena galeata UHCC 0370]